MEDLLVRYGLPAIFFGAVIDGDIALLVAGVVTHLGMLALLPVLVVGAFGLFVSDILWFLVGRYAGPRLRETALYRRAERGVERIAGRAGPWQIVVARVVYGTRVATMLFWVVSGVWMWWEIKPARTWGAGFALAGFALFGLLLATI